VRAEPRWLAGPFHDMCLAFCWVPVSIAAYVLTPRVEPLRYLIGIVFLISFAHQPLTLALVYGDRTQYEARRLLYRITPLIAFAAVAIGTRISLSLVAVVAGLWNIEHTLMQRYGVARIYGRKGGDDHGRLEKQMIFSWLAVAMGWLAAFADLPGLVRHIGMGSTNARGVEILHRTQPIAVWLVVPLIAIALFATVSWALAEYRSPNTRNPAKYAYLLATFSLLVLIGVRPIAGFAGFVAGHSIEYFGIVHRSLRSRASTGDSSAIARATASPVRRLVTYGFYAAVMIGFIQVARSPFNGELYGFSILFLGALHIFYDGFVWKLRRPQLAASLGIN
jgi:hypothetical protein